MSYEITSGTLTETVAFRCTATFKQMLERAAGRADMDESEFVKKAVYEQMQDNGDITYNE